MNGRDRKSIGNMLTVLREALATSPYRTFIPPPVEAVHEQLGLVLERTKSPVDVPILDHVEKTPSKP